MIVQSTKATQADFARDFLTLTNDFQDESDWTMSEDDEDDFQNADGYYHQSWKSLPPTTIDAGRAHSSDEHALQYRPVSVKSLPLNNDAALAQEDGESSTHFKLSRKKLSNAHLQVSSGVEKRIVSADVIEGSLDDIEHTNQPTENENALSSGTQELPLFKRKHAPMSAEEQTRQAAFLRAKLADFEAADPKPTTSVQNDGRRSLEKGLKRGRKRKAAKVEEVIAEESSQSVLEKCVKNSESETSRTYEEEISKEEESTAVGDKSKKMHSKGKKTKTCDDQTHPDFHASESEMFWLGPLIYPTWPLQRVHGTRKMARLRKAKNAKRVNREVKEVPQKVKNLVAKLKQMGTPLQEALSQFARNALRCAVSESNRGGGGSIIDVVDRWKASSNGHLSDLEQILYQYGGVQEPADSIASKPVKNESVQLSSHELQRELNHFGAPFEDALCNVADVFKQLQQEKEFEDIVIEKSMPIIKKWILSNRHYLADVAEILGCASISTDSKTCFAWENRKEARDTEESFRKDSAFNHSEGENGRDGKVKGEEMHGDG